MPRTAPPPRNYDSSSTKPVKYFRDVSLFIDPANIENYHIDPTLNYDKIRTICKTLQSGLPINKALALALIKRTAYNEWMKRGRAILNTTKLGTDYDEMCAKLVLCVQAAEAKFIESCVVQLHNAAQGINYTTSERHFRYKKDKETGEVEKVLVKKQINNRYMFGDWRADAFLLERRCPEEFSVNRIVDPEDYFNNTADYIHELCAA